MLNTHRQILDAAEQVDAQFNSENEALYAKFRQKRAALQAECAAIGHMFGKSNGVGLGFHRACVFCGSLDPANTVRVVSGITPLSGFNQPQTNPPVFGKPLADQQTTYGSGVMCNDKKQGG